MTEYKPNSPRSMPEREFRFTLSIPRQEYLRYYQGAAGHVVVRSLCGLRLRFPARLLRTFVTHRGVYGEFSLLIDDTNRVLHLERLSGTA